MSITFAILTAGWVIGVNISRATQRMLGNEKPDLTAAQVIALIWLAATLFSLFRGV